MAVPIVVAAGKVAVAVVTDKNVRKVVVGIILGILIIIVAPIDNCQITIAGGFAPGSESAEIISKAMGSRTVLSGSVSRSRNDPSQSLQMIERPLMTPDELKSMKKGRFIVLKTGAHPFVSRLKLFFK